jgi:hypothetical protein
MIADGEPPVFIYVPEVLRVSPENLRVAIGNPDHSRMAAHPLVMPVISVCISGIADKK